MNNPGHSKWIGFGALVGFGSSFIFGDLLTLPIDLYYLIYFGILIFPYVIFANYYFCLGFALFNGIIVILIFTFYVSAAKDISFWRDSLRWRWSVLE